MVKTFMAKEEGLKRAFYVVDAKDKILGRLATKVASVLRGKHKPIYTPHIDCGDNVIVINADQVKVTGKKLKDKIYPRYSGYPGGLREIPLEVMMKNNSACVIRLAVRRMLPINPLGRRLITKLKVYKDAKFPKMPQEPINLPV